MPNRVPTDFTPHDILGFGSSPFGSEVVELLPDNFEDSHELDTEAHQVVRALRNAIRQLVDAKDEVSIAAVEHVNDAFRLGHSEFSDEEPLPTGVYKTNILGWIANRASEVGVAEFCAWNFKKHAFTRDKMARERSWLRASIPNQTKKLVQIGYFPEVAIEAMDRSLEFYNRIDPIDDFECGYNHIAGYCTPNQLALSAGLRGIVIDIVGFHEYLHGTEHQDPTKTHKKEIISGYWPGSSTGWGRWANEAYVTHSAEVAVLDKATLHRPFHKPEDATYGANWSYMNERRLLAFVLEGGSEPIPMSVFSDAYFKRLHYRMQREFHAMLSANFSTLFPERGNRALDFFNQRYEAAYEAGRAHDLVQNYLYRLTGEKSEQTDTPQPTYEVHAAKI